MNDQRQFDLVVIGGSSGGMQALKLLLRGLPENFRLPIAVVLHVSPLSDGSWTQYLDSVCEMAVKEVDEKERFKPGTVYMAPANYHLLVEKDRTFTLTVDEHVNFARPAIDVLFDTAAYAFGAGVVGIVMTGANSDGAKGLRSIRDAGGLTIVQDPGTAETPQMPEAALRLAEPEYVLPIPEIQQLLLRIHNKELE